jgi:hypothetical protein
MARAILCELAPQKVSSTAPKKRDAGTKVVLQPRLCTLRSYGAGSGVVTRRILAGEEDGSGAADSGGSSASPFFASLANYIESSRKSQDFETISGRLAMVNTPRSHRYNTWHGYPVVSEKDTARTIFFNKIIAQ